MTVVISGSSGIQNVLGSAASPAESNTTNSNTGVYFPTSTTLGFSTAGTNAVYIDASQNVGIGTTSPVYTLDVGGPLANIRVAPSTATNNALTRYVNTGGTGYVGLDSSAGGLTSAYALNLYHTGAYPIVFSTSGTERARIDSSGNLLVGSTTALSGNTFKALSGNAAATFSTATSTNFSLVYFNNGTYCGSITTNGATTSYNPSSDARLKENIAPITNGLARVSKLKPVDYNWKSDGRLDNGFIAQDLLAEQEFAIRVNPVGKAEDGSDMYGVDYMKFVAVLTAAIQEQQALITQLTDRIAALEAR
jgi:hypothetical protein